MYNTCGILFCSSEKALQYGCRLLSIVARIHLVNWCVFPGVCIVDRRRYRLPYQKQWNTTYSEFSYFDSRLARKRDSKVPTSELWIVQAVTNPECEPRNLCSVVFSRKGSVVTGNINNGIGLLRKKGYWARSHFSRCIVWYDWYTKSSILYFT